MRAHAGQAGTTRTQGTRGGERLQYVVQRCPRTIAEAVRTRTECTSPPLLRRFTCERSRSSRRTSHTPGWSDAGKQEQNRARTCQGVGGKKWAHTPDHSPQGEAMAGCWAKTAVSETSRHDHSHVRSRVASVTGMDRCTASCPRTRWLPRYASQVILQRRAAKCLRREGVERDRFDRLLLLGQESRARIGLYT